MSITFKDQSIRKEKTFKIGDENYRIRADIRHDDRCGNGHNTFSITGSIDLWNSDRCKWMEYSGGCIHSEIAEHFPELAPYIKWHLTSTDGPLHYVANSMYHASDKDCWGLSKGERRQIRNGKTGLPAWHLVAINKATGAEVELYELTKSVDSIQLPPCEYTMEYRPWCRVGEGKEPDLKAARETAIWPEAELEDFTKEKLEARLPSLIAEFKGAVETLGLKF